MACGSSGPRAGAAWAAVIVVRAAAAPNKPASFLSMAPPKANLIDELALHSTPEATSHYAEVSSQATVARYEISTERSHNARAVLVELCMLDFAARPLNIELVFRSGG